LNNIYADNQSIGPERAKIAKIKEQITGFADNFGYPAQEAD
jgi:hypothetical protein